MQVNIWTSLNSLRSLIIVSVYACTWSVTPTLVRTCGEVWSFIFEEQRHFNWEMNLARLMYAAPNAKVYTMLLPIMPMQEEVWYNNRYLCIHSTVWATIFYDRCPQQPFCVPMYYSMWITLYIQTLVQYQTAIVKITCLAMLSNHAHIQDIPICVKYDDLSLQSRVNFNCENNIQRPYKMSGPWRIN